MKKKDIITIVIAVAVLAIAGLLLYSHSSGQGSSSKQTAVEVIDPISPTFDSRALGQLQDPSITQNFSVPIDLSGLGNTQPFGPLH